MNRFGAGAALAVAGIALVAGGCAAPHQPAPAATGSGPGSSSAPVVHSSPAAAYLAIAATGNRRLDADFDHLDGRDHADLPQARVDLRDIAATERTFDRQLAHLALPPDAAAWARTLIRANEARADLTTRAATSTTLARLQHLHPALTAANAPVERAVTAIRATLGLPPPNTS